MLTLESKLTDDCQQLGRKIRGMAYKQMIGTQEQVCARSLFRQKGMLHGTLGILIKELARLCQLQLIVRRLS
jgi:hypothetical protein